MRGYPSRWDSGGPASDSIATTSMTSDLRLPALTLSSGIVTVCWVAFTLVQVARCGLAALASPDSPLVLMPVRVGDGVTSAPGLTYCGTEGVALAAGQLTLVTLAVVAGLRRPLLPRRAGLAVLASWSLLWLGSALWREHLAGGQHPALTTYLAAPTIVALAFCALRWRSASEV